MIKPNMSRYFFDISLVFDEFIEMIFSTQWYLIGFFKSLIKMLNFRLVIIFYISYGILMTENE